MKRILTILLILWVATITGCYYDNEEKLYPVLSTDCDLTTVTFSGTIKPILQASCYTCHSNANYLSAGAGIKLENHPDLKAMAESGKLMGAVRHESGFIPMPHGGGKLSDCEISKLQQWVENQMPNN